MAVKTAEIKSMHLDQNKKWVVKFAVPETEIGINEMTLKIDAVRTVDRGPEETKTIEEVATEARLTLANALWPVMRAAIEGTGKDGIWEQFIGIARSASDGALQPSDHDASTPSTE